MMPDGRECGAAGNIPDFSFVAETVFSGKLQFGVETGCLEGSGHRELAYALAKNG